jgi:hypothetical protein
MAEERTLSDQQFGHEAAKDQERADDAQGTSAEGRVAADIDGKAPRAGNKAEDVVDRS